MKTTNKVLLGALGLVIVAMVVVLIIIRGFVAGSVEVRELSAEEKELVEQEYDLAGFEGIRTKGVWEIDIDRGQEYSVRVKSSRYLSDRLEVRTEGNELVLDLAERTSINLGSHTLRATVVMPELKRLDTAGGTSITLAGFVEEELAVAARGASSLHVTDSSFQDVVLEIEGAGDIDMRDAETQNAEVHVSGAGSVKLTMTGGRLTGSLEGAASVDYYGTVSEESVSTKGVSSVRAR